jgi:hypothetical protein
VTRALVGAALLAFACACTCAVARAAGAGEPAERFTAGDVRFDHPAGFTVEPAGDVSAEAAFRLEPPADARVQSAIVLVGSKRVTDGDFESASAEWHAAHLRNRAAWGMRVAGGPPRDQLQLGSRRALRWRDRIGGALGPSEQTFACAHVTARLACVLITAPHDARDAADALAAQLLSTLSIKTRR